MWTMWETFQNPLQTKTSSHNCINPNHSTQQQEMTDQVNHIFAECQIQLLFYNWRISY